jgi:hypothetical protein
MHVGHSLAARYGVSIILGTGLAVGFLSGYLVRYAQWIDVVYAIAMDGLWIFMLAISFFGLAVFLKNQSCSLRIKRMMISSLALIPGIFAYFYSTTYFDARAFSEARAYVDAVVPSIDAYRAKNGHYPARLEDVAGLPPAPYGLEYHAPAEGFFTDADCAFILWGSSGFIGEDHGYCLQLHRWRDFGS